VDGIDPIAFLIEECSKKHALSFDRSRGFDGNQMTHDAKRSSNIFSQVGGSADGRSLQEREGRFQSKSQ
jgi:hypothetical protein